MTPSETPTVYYFTSGADDARHGPYTGPQLKQLAKQGVLKPTDIIWQAGSSKTTPAAKIKGLFATPTEAAVKQAIPMAAVAAPAPSPFATVSPFAAAPMKQAPPPIVTEQVYEAEIVEDAPTTKKYEPPIAPPTAWLEDPMREISVRFASLLSRIFIWSLIASTVLWIFTWMAPTGILSTLASGLLFSIGFFFPLYLVNLVWWRAFAPRRGTDVFYLRSFKNDEASWPIRVAMQEALGDNVRLSGIRDPVRREAAVSEGLFPWMKAMRHCTPKFMDLEAQEDWQSRLWNSLQHGTMAVIDLSVTTPFVLDEVRLVSRAITIDRTLFLGSLPQTEDELRQMIASQLGDASAANARVLLWPGSESGANSKDQVRQFREELKHLYNDIAARPPLAATPVPPEFVVEAKEQSKTPMSRTMLRWMIRTQLVLIGLYFLLFLFSRALSSSPSVQLTVLLLGMLPVFFLNSLFFYWNLWVYIRDVGIFRRRVKAIVLLLILMSFGIPVVRGAAHVLRRPLPDAREAPSKAELESDRALLAAEDGALL